MSKHLVITIGRQCGSGGHEVGEKLAERLGIKLYDKEIIDKTSELSGLCKEIIESYDEKHDVSFLYYITMNTYNINTDLPLNFKVFAEEAKTVRKIASEEDCVIVGRCADYILEGNIQDDIGVETINVFISAPKLDRVKRVMSLYGLDYKKAKQEVERVDKSRKNYYEFNSGKTWEDSSSYDILLNRSKFGIDTIVDMLEKVYKDMKKV